MNDWEKDLKIYRLEQAPPKYENYQEYFERYFAEKDEMYLAWFLHYCEKELNTKAKELALDHKLQAQEDPVYATTQYPKDMTRDALYAEASKYLT